jgi:hypothetical protein
MTEKGRVAAPWDRGYTNFLKLGRLENEPKDGGASRIAFDAGSAAVISVISESSEEVD